MFKHCSGTMTFSLHFSMGSLKGLFQYQYSKNLGHHTYPPTNPLDQMNYIEIFKLPALS